MSFEKFYSWMLTDPKFGEIRCRKQHFHECYVIALKRALELCEGESDSVQCIARIEEEIANERRHK